jgi:hypothetical protein
MSEEAISAICKNIHCALRFAAGCPYQYERISTRKWWCIYCSSIDDQLTNETRANQQLRTFTFMNPLVLVIILLLLFGGGGFYWGGPVYGGGGLGLVLLICLIILLTGGFRRR